MNIFLATLCVALAVALAAMLVYFNSQIKKMNEMAERNFRLMSAESLEKNTKSLSEANADQLAAILSPLRIRLEDFRKAMEKSHTDAVAGRRSLSDQIERLSKLNLSIGEEARNLSTALRGNNRIQGQWGEMVLQSLLEQAGMKKGINFETQVTRENGGMSIRNEDGRLQRPDLVIYLPEKRNIIVDSKTSLSAYLDFCESISDEEAEEALKRHVLSVRKHIGELSARDYSASISGAAEHVIMFIPNDAAFIAALDNDRDLPGYAMTHGVTLASPSTMTGIIGLVAQIWRKESQDRNAAEIARLGGLLYDTVAGFVNDLQNVERNLGLAQKAYSAAFVKLTSGPRSVLSRAERLRDMGAKTTRRLPDDIVERGTDPDSVSAEVSELETEVRN